ncbi:hypothetical protein RDABS01_035687 [Bienertia sinuspersici]
MDGSLPFRNLGIQISAKKLSKDDCAMLVEKIIYNIRRWGSKSMSYTGRAVLVNSVLMSMPLYWERIFILPKAVIQEFNSKYIELPMDNEFDQNEPIFDAKPYKSDIDPYGDRFLQSQTMNVLHLGTRTTNRIESAHATLKPCLKSSTGSMDTIWSKIHSFWELREIKVSFQRSEDIDPHVTVLRKFMLLKGKVTHKALRLLDKEYKRADFIKDEEDCGCYLRKTHGLPCSHETKRFETEGRGIQLSDIHPFWKTLKIKASESPVHDHPFHNFQIRHNIDKVLHSFFIDILGENEERKKVIAYEIEKMIHPEFTTLKEPVVNEQGKGRPPLPPKNSTRRDPSAWE